jgi:predicted TIM-barrel fold metal-dependent hydrolase
MLVIDTHCHVVSPDTRKYPLAPIGGTQSDWSSERPTTPDQLAAAMDDAGIAKSVVVQASTAYGHDSSYCAEAVAGRPQRFTGVFSIDPLEPDAVKTAEGWLRRGMTGMRVFTTGSSMPGQQTWLDDERAFPVWKMAGDRRIPIAVQMTAQGIPLLLKIVEKFPSTPFLLDHLARPTISDGPPYKAAASMFDLARYPSLYMKITSRTIEQSQSDKATPETFFPLLVKTFGADRLMWGSNFPAHPEPLSTILHDAREALASLSTADQTNIFSGTALKLYPALA